MKLAGVIAEYNPFHNGHAYHLAQTRAQGATHIAVAMSGSFVQRGDAAVCSKWSRAAAAVQGGADLVVELPAPYALSSARTFARAGVFLLNQLGADCVSFGSEEGDAEALREAAALSDEAEDSLAMREYLSMGMSYPRARAAAVAQIHGENWAEIITKANNLLGIEYIRAVNEINPSLALMTLPRAQALHDEETAGETIASASYVRRLFRKGEFGTMKRYLPDEAFDRYVEEISALRAPVTERSAERMLLYRMREMKAGDFARLPDVSEGLENRLYRAAREAVSLEDFYMRVKTKRYTMARIRRISFCALLGITRESQEGMPGYLRVLAANGRGMEILNRAKNAASVPIGTKFADLNRLRPEGIETDIRATDLYALMMPRIRPCGLDFTENPVIFPGAL